MDRFRPCENCSHSACCKFKDSYKKFMNGPAKELFENMPDVLEIYIHCKYRRSEDIGFWPNNVR